MYRCLLKSGIHEVLVLHLDDLQGQGIAFSPIQSSGLNRLWNVEITSLRRGSSGFIKWFWLLFQAKHTATFIVSNPLVN